MHDWFTQPKYPSGFKVADILQLVRGWDDCLKALGGRGSYLVSTEDRKDDQKTEIYSTWIVTDRDVEIGMPIFLSARTAMRSANFRIIGTRVFCYESDLPSRKIVVLHIWNPMSVNSDAMHVNIEETQIPHGYRFSGQIKARFPFILS